MSHYTPSRPVLCSRETLLCPNKGCKQQRPDRMFHSPMLPIELCSAIPLHSNFLHMLSEHGVFRMLRINPMISNYPPLMDCLVSLAVCRVDMMILRLQCKRIVLQFFWHVLCTLQLNRSGKKISGGMIFTALSCLNKLQHIIKSTIRLPQLQPGRSEGLKPKMYPSFI